MSNASIHEDPPLDRSQTTEDLLPQVYQDLRRLAADRLSRLTPGQTLQPTALVHEAWLRLAEGDQHTWQNRAHFFATVADVMRLVLVDHVRRRTRLKRGGGQKLLNIDDLNLTGTSDDEKVLLINEALEQLQRVDPEETRIVVMKFFGGLTDQEIAQELGVTDRTVERKWAYAKAWLLRRILDEK